MSTATRAAATVDRGRGRRAGHRADWTASASIERGVRADEHVPGHGLGLAMVRETVALYGGKFFIDDSVALRGARVELQLPGR